MTPRFRPRPLLVFVVVTIVVAMSAPAGLAARGVAQFGPQKLQVLVTDSRDVPLAGATVTNGPAVDVTDRFGRAELLGAVPGTVLVSHPRFPSRSASWSGAGDRLVVAIGAPVLRAIHVAGTLPGTRQWDNLVALAGRTAVNAFMLDIKDESGRVFATTESSWARAAGADRDRWDLAAVVAQLHGDGLAVIGRIVSFQDPIAGRTLPDMAVHNRSGGVFSRRGQTFLDPTDPNAREYALELAVEACAAGVDEVQFDYVRFPDGNHSLLSFDGGSTAESRTATIVGFLQDAQDRLPDGCQVAADIFGFVTSVPTDGGIGQQLEALAGVADVLSPMAYPNHWSSGWFGYSTPAHHPGGVITASMSDAIVRTGGLTTLRPWLQDFGGYGPAQVRAQIDAADALGLGWMIWNAGSVFTEAGLPLDGEPQTSAELSPVVEQSRPRSGYWDVPDRSTFSADVAWLGQQGITHGCNPPWADDYCPSRPLTRGQAASMLVRALGLAPSTVDYFADDAGSTHEADINALAEAGITNGCAASTFCPLQVLQRGQMASLIARALDLAPGPTGSFVDDNGSVHETDIERLVAAGLTNGCAVERFCPDRPTRRDEVAAFLHRALG